MKNTLLFTLLAVFIAFGANAQIAINEFLPADGRVEIKNTGTVAVNVSDYQLCSFPTYNALSDLNLESGSLMLEPGALLVVQGHTPPGDINDNELGLYITSGFTNPDNMVDYVEWGSTGHTRSEVAVAASIWQTGDFITAPAAGMSVLWDGTDDSVSSWSTGASNFGQVNFAGCDVNAGVITTNDATTICAGDDVSDMVTVAASGVMGTNSIFVITDESGNLMDSQVENVFDFDAAGAGVCLIWHLSYEDDVNLDVENADDLDGCFSLSNAITITRIITDASEVTIGGSNADVTVVVNDGDADLLTFENDSDSDADYMYIITDSDGVILATVEDSNDFEGSLAGECHVYGISYTGALTAEAGENITSATSDGCFEVTETFLTVIREIIDIVTEADNKNITVYPTVIENQLTVTGIEAGFNLTIFSLSGQVVFNERIVSKIVELPSFSAGVYVAQITSGAVNKSFRLIKN